MTEDWTGLTDAERAEKLAEALKEFPDCIFDDDRGNARIRIGAFHAALEGSRAALASYRAAQEAAPVQGGEADPDGWIPWEGGECPVDQDAEVDVEFRNGERIMIRRAYIWSGDSVASVSNLWKHEGDPDYHIVAYRRSKEPRS